MSHVKQRRADPDIEAVARAHKRKAEPGAGGPARRAEADARGDRAKLQQNRERLGVTPEHKTRSMKKGRRGTYP